MPPVILTGQVRPIDRPTVADRHKLYYEKLLKKTDKGTHQRAYRQRVGLRFKSSNVHHRLLRCMRVACLQCATCSNQAALKAFDRRIGLHPARGSAQAATLARSSDSQDVPDGRARWAAWKAQDGRVRTRRALATGLVRSPQLVRLRAQAHGRGVDLFCMSFRLDGRAPEGAATPHG